MIDISKIEEIAEQVRRVLPQGAQELQKEIKANVRLVLESAFARMDLVTREEFDAQSALLARTRAKLEELEQALAKLETRDRSEARPDSPRESGD